MHTRAQALADAGLIKLSYRGKPTPEDFGRLMWSFDGVDYSVSVDTIALILKDDLDPEYRENWQQMFDRLLPIQTTVNDALD